MKTLSLILALIFTVMFSSPSFAYWKRLGKNVEGTTYYVDFERIRKQGGYVYFWELQDLLKPNKDGDLSYKPYRQGDCKLFRYKTLSVSLHTQPMGEGTPSASSNKPEKEWHYPPPNSPNETILKTVCEYVN
jgi:hypothetical protein